MIISHLLPNARAWRITTDKKLRQFFEGLSYIPDDVKNFADGLWGDINPYTTRALEAWESQFGLSRRALTEAQRRDSLDAAWKEKGGQDPQYIQDTLQANGFDVYVHEWWQPGTWPHDAVYCDEVVAECGEVVAECTSAVYTPFNPFNYLSPDNRTRITGKGYPLITKVSAAAPVIIPVSGEEVAECGEPTALCYNHVEFSFERKLYEVPEDKDTWPYFLYIGAEIFGDLAVVPESRREELEDLILKISPSQQWIGALIEYS